MSKIVVPSVGESITEVTIAAWMKKNGDFVNIDEPICEIESDKASMELPAPQAGILDISASEGDTVDIGSVIGSIKPGAKPSAGKTSDTSPAPVNSSTTNNSSNVMASPAAMKILNEKNIDPASIVGSGKGGRITKEDALNAKAAAPARVQSPEVVKTAPAAGSVATGKATPRPLSEGRSSTKNKMSALRKTIAKRLVAVKQTTAMLTTFNEVDMTGIKELRAKYKESFKEKHQIGLGFMSFFTKACCIALEEFPSVNGQIEGTDILHFNYCDVGIAVSTPKGLVVPVVRDAQSLSLASIEKSIRELATRARDGKLKLSEMQGGTFTITNGGVFGSMLSTPIINQPQSAILGMHNIVDRPMAVNGEVKIRPIMYLALSYDHRIVDGKQSVSFLKRVKELLEDPARLLLDV